MYMFEDYKKIIERKNRDKKEKDNQTLKELLAEYKSTKVDDLASEIDLEKIVKKSVAAEVLAERKRSRYGVGIYGILHDNIPYIAVKIAKEIENNYYEGVLSRAGIDKNEIKFGSEEYSRFSKIEASMDDVRNAWRADVTKKIVPLLEEFEKTAKESRNFSFTEIQAGYIKDCVLPQFYLVLQEMAQNGTLASHAHIKPHSILGQSEDKDGFQCGKCYRVRPNEVGGVFKEMMDSVMNSKWAPEVTFEYYMNEQGKECVSARTAYDKAWFVVDWGFDKEISVAKDEENLTLD